MADKIDKPLDFLKEEMESDQIAVRVNAMSRTPIIAALIGNSAVEKDLIPYLDGLIAKEDDEVVYAITRQLSKYYPTLTKKFQVLVPLLENLCQFEETVVREAAIQCMIDIADKITEEDCISVIVPCILRLADGAWFTSKVSAIILMSAIYEKTGEYKTSLRKKYKELSTDETLMIRRAIAQGIGKLSSKMKIDNFVQDMIPIVKVLINDEQDSVRLVCLDSIVEMSKSFPKEMNKSTIIPILIPMIRDRAWKVRIKIAGNFTRLAEHMGIDIADNTLLSIFSTLLSDPEGEVRLGAAENFVGLMRFISKSKYPGLIPQLAELVKDSLPLVRVAGYDIFATIINSLSKEDIKQKIIGAFLQNFKTEKDTEVKIMLLRALTCCGITLGAELLAIITNQDINFFLKEKSWRVRKEVYNLIVEVACNSRSNQLFEVHFQEFFLGYLNDQVYQIRVHGSALLPRILEIEPASWVSNVFIPRVQKLRAQEGSSTYLKRVTALYAFQHLISANPQALSAACVQEVLPELKEKVPNVRLVALKVLRAVHKVLDDSSKSAVKSAASALVADPDPDVRGEALAISKL